MIIDKVGIECKECLKQWRIEIPVSKNEIDAFATLCECGAIIVGNRKNGELRSGIDDETRLKERYLTNGSFQIVTDNKEKALLLPLLELE